MSFVNPNPNEPDYPYGGGTDNPGDNTALPGGPSDVASVETGLPLTKVLYPPIIPTLAAGGTDTVLPAGVQAVPPAGLGFEAPDDTELDTDTGGDTVDPVTGDVRVPGQDETVGETETTSGIAPVAFPEPTP